MKINFYVIQKNGKNSFMFKKIKICQVNDNFEYIVYSFIFI